MRLIGLIAFLCESQYETQLSSFLLSVAVTMMFILQIIKAHEGKVIF